MAMTMQKPMAFPSTHPGTFGEAPGMSARDMREKYAGKPAFNDPTIGQVVMFDGKRMRKAVHRKTIDYNTSIVNYLEDRIWQRDFRDRRALQPDPLYQIEMTPPMHMYDNSINCVTTKFIRTSTNKFRCPIFCLAWTPEGRRLVTGASSGEFTLWNGLTFNFETILQAHDTSCRAMQWSHNDSWMVTADHSGYIKYWQSNMNNVKMYQGHKEPIRGISFCPTDSKFATCSDDGTVRIWDFMKCIEEKILRGHGADVKCVDWHPQKSLVASGSKDNQQPLKLWDAKTGTSLATIHAHKGTVMSLKWNKNGNWLLTASRDHLMKLFDIRNMKEELQTFKGHKKEATAVAWHPIHESLIVSGGSDGAVLFWNVGTDKEVGGMEEAHEGMVWSIAWHPMGHILATGSNDHTTKFWTRNRPGDRMRDKYNLNTLPGGSEHELPEYEVENQNTNQSILSIPGMGLPLEKEQPAAEIEDEAPVIPGLDWSNDSQYMKETHYIPKKKIPYAKPIPWEFEQAWADKHSVPISKDSDAEKKKQENKTKGIPSLLDTPIMLKPGILPQNVPNDGNPGQGPDGNIVSPASTNRPEMPGSGPPNPNINMMRGVNVNETRPNTPVIRPSGGSGILGPGPANLIFRGQLMGPGGPGFRPNGQAMRPPGPNLGPGGQNIRPGGPFMGQGLIRMNVGGPNIRPGGPRVPLERGDNWNEQMVGGPQGSFGDRPQNGTWQNEAEEESWKSDKGPESGGYQDYEMTENWEEGEGNYSTYSEGEKPAEYHGEDGYGNQRPQNREPRAHMREDRGRPPDGFHQKRGGYFGRERSEDRHQGQQMYPEDESMETDDSFHQASHPGRDMDTYPESEHYANREDSYYGRDTRQGGMESHRGSFREGDQWSTSPRARGRGFRGVGERGRGVDRGRGIMNRGQGGMERGRGGMERGRGMDRGRGMERGRGGMERGWRGDRGRIGGRGPRGMRGRYNGT